MTALLVVIAVLAAVDLAAQRWGVDSRRSGDWRDLREGDLATLPR